MRSAGWGGKVAHAFTIREFLKGLQLRPEGGFLRWPPDCFALCLALLKHSGAYAQLLQDWPPGRSEGRTLGVWTSEARELGKQWRSTWLAGKEFDGLSAEWRLLCQSLDNPLTELGQKSSTMRSTHEASGDGG